MEANCQQSNRIARKPKRHIAMGRSGLCLISVVIILSSLSYADGLTCQKSYSTTGAFSAAVSNWIQANYPTAGVKTCVAVTGQYCTRTQTTFGGSPAGSISAYGCQSVQDVIRAINDMTAVTIQQSDVSTCNSGQAVWKMSGTTNITACYCNNADQCNGARSSLKASLMPTIVAVAVSMQLVWSRQ